MWVGHRLLFIKLWGQGIEMLRGTRLWTRAGLAWLATVVLPTDAEAPATERAGKPIRRSYPTAPRLDSTRRGGPQ